MIPESWKHEGGHERLHADVFRDDNRATYTPAPHAGGQIDMQAPGLKIHSLSGAATSGGADLESGSAPGT